MLSPRDAGALSSAKIGCCSTKASCQLYHHRDMPSPLWVSFSGHGHQLWCATAIQALWSLKQFSPQHDPHLKHSCLLRAQRSMLLLTPSCCLPQRLVRSQEQLLHRNQQWQEPSSPRTHYWGKKKIQQRTLKQAAKMYSLDGKLHSIAACASWVFPTILKYAITAFVLTD